MNDLKIFLAAALFVGGTVAVGVASTAPAPFERHSQTMDLQGDDSEWTRPFFETKRQVLRQAARGQS